MKNILVLTDFSNCSNAALKVAVSIAQKHDAHIEILHVIESPEFQYPTLDFSAIPVSYFSEIKKELFEQADKQLKKLEDRAGMFNVSIGAHVEEGTMYQVLTDVIAKENYDLIVLGTKGSDGIEEALIGSNAQKIVRYSNVPVLTVSHMHNDFDFTNVLIASDFKEVTKMKAETLKTMLDFEGVKVHMLGVTTPLEPEQRENIEMRIDEFATACGLLDYERKVIYDKDVTEAITEHAKKIKADAVLMYTHGYTGIKQWFHSSLAESVVNHSTVPVLTMKFSD